LADVWKENLSEDLKLEEVKFGSVGEFLLKLKKEFGGGDKESVKVAELRRIEQVGRTIEEFVQEFQRVVRGSRYEGKALVKEFKREMNRMIRRNLMEAERPLTSIEQWYQHATNLTRH